MTRWLCAAVLLLTAAVGHAQTTTVTATIVDPSGQAWGSSSWTANVISSLNPPVTLPGYNPFTTQFSGTADSSGNFSVTVQQVAHIYPANSTWQFCVVSGVSYTQRFCVNVPVGNSGQTSQDISSQINAIITTPVIAGGPAIRAYTDTEVQAFPGATYFNVVNSTFRCFSGVWGTCGGGGGGGGSPAAPANAIQLANSGVNGFNADANFLIDPAAHTLISKANMHINALQSGPENSFDPMDTMYDGGLAAAIANTSGFTPTQVIQAAEDYGECQYLMGLGPQRIKIPLPNGLTIPIGKILLWGQTDFGGESLAAYPTLQHNDSTGPMVSPHLNGDSITCSNHVTYHPAGPAGNLFIHDVGIAGMGAIASANDIGLEIDGGSMISEIVGAGNGFAGQAILEQGLQNYIWRAGYPAAQIKGCQAFTSGLLPPSASVTSGICTSVEMYSTDSEMDFVYATDGAQFNTGHAAGPCYPSCGAIAVGNNAEASFLFGQVSDIDFLVGGNNIRGKDWRADGTSREGVYLQATSGGDVIDGIMIIGPCTDIALQAAYTAGTPTGCSGVFDLGQTNILTSVNSGGSAGIFGPSFQECVIKDVVSGTAPSPNTYGLIPGKGDPNNLTQNDKYYCGYSQGDASSAKALFPSMAPLAVNGASANVSGTTSISLATTTPLMSIQGAIAGQWLLVYGVAGSSIATTGNIHTCTGLPETPTSFPILLNNHGGYASVVGNAPNNVWQEVCNTPQNNYVHLNWTGNPTPSNPAVVDFYGNETSRQVPTLALGGAIQLHGPNAPSGQYCYEEENIYADGSDNVSPLGCSTVDLTNQAPGFIVAIPTPEVVTMNLYLVSNTTGSGISTGKYPAPAVGPSFDYWDGITTIAAGGDGSTPPPASQNTTGMIFSPWGMVNATAGNAQPACNAFTRGRQWMIDGGGTGPDTFQICVKTTGSAYAWVTH